MANHTATHPGFASAVTKGYTAPTCNTADTDPGVKASATAQFNEGEEQRVMEWRIKDYVLPKRRTTYVDFAFNFNVTDKDEFHIVWGEAIVHLKAHLHHFTIKGCPALFPEDKVGVPLLRSEIPAECDKGMGGGWAPGRLMWDFPTNSGQAIGKAAGIFSFVINVHFTDAEQVTTDIISKDGIRMHYTPDLRKYTTRTGNVILIGAAQKDLTIAGGVKRSFLTRTCTVRPTCSDAVLPSTLAERMFSGGGLDPRARSSGDAANASVTPNPNAGRMSMLMPLIKDMKSCADFKANALIGGLFCKNKIFYNLCHLSCSEVVGNPCTKGKMEPLKMVSAGYHAHLLGREMYAFLWRMISVCHIPLLLRFGK